MHAARVHSDLHLKEKMEVRLLRHSIRLVARHLSIQIRHQVHRLTGCFTGIPPPLFHLDSSLHKALLFIHILSRATALLVSSYYCIFLSSPDLSLPAVPLLFMMKTMSVKSSVSVIHLAICLTTVTRTVSKDYANG